MDIAHRFVPQFRSLGLSVRLSRALSARVWDLASFNNRDERDVAERVCAGVAGEVGPVRGLGVYLVGADPAARAEAILHQTAAAAGDFGLNGG